MLLAPTLLTAGDASAIGNVVVQGNLIGTDATGMQPIGNGNFGVSALQRSGGTIASVLIGGPTTGAGNVISDSDGFLYLLRLSRRRAYRISRSRAMTSV